MVTYSICGRGVVTFHDFLPPCHSVVVIVFQNIFGAIGFPPRDLHVAKNYIPKFRILWSFEICRKWPKTLLGLATMRYDHVSRMTTYDDDDILWYEISRFICIRFSPNLVCIFLVWISRPICFNFFSKIVRVLL